METSRYKNMFISFYRRFCSLIALILVPFFLLIARGNEAIAGNFADTALVLSRVPFYLGERIRFYFYRTILKSVGTNVIFKYGSFCQYRNTVIGDRVLIGYFNSLGEVSIGDNVLFGGFVNILSGTAQHSFDNPDTLIIDQIGKRRMVRIGSDVWIGSNAVICNDVGDRCVIGAGSVVLKAVESHSVAGGNPARTIKKI